MDLYHSMWTTQSHLRDVMFGGEWVQTAISKRFLLSSHLMMIDLRLCVFLSPASSINTSHTGGNGGVSVQHAFSDGLIPPNIKILLRFTFYVCVFSPELQTVAVCVNWLILFRAKGEYVFVSRMYLIEIDVSNKNLNLVVWEVLTCKKSFKHSSIETMLSKTRNL